MTLPRTPTIAALVVLIVMLLPTSASAAAQAPDPAQIDAYLAGKGSPMAGQGSAFVASGARWQVDPRLLVAIAGAESSFGQITCAPFNAWGWGCPNGPYRFTSWADGIETVTRGLRTGYLAEGRTTVAAIHAKYAPVGAANDPTGLNNNWTINVSRFLTELGGDPSDVDMDGVAGTYPVGVGSGTSGEEQVDARAARESSRITVPAGGRATLVVRATNSGTGPWTPTTVRLRRLDAAEGVASAPIAALRERQVKPGGEGSFTVQVSTAPGLRGPVGTRWQIEGPGGPAGDELPATVDVTTAGFAAANGTVSAPRSLAFGATGTFVARFANVGTETWKRSGSGAVILTGTSTGAQLTQVADAGARGDAPGAIQAQLLEREVAPGETGTFAWRMRYLAEGEERGASSSISVMPARDGEDADGEPVRFSVEVGP